MQKILVVEDDRELNSAICYALKKEHYEVCSVYSISEAQRACGQSAISLVLLDVNLPDGEGWLFCKWIKKQGNVPVLFLTARDLEEDALLGYELGAEDYITKPFSMKILLKKIQIVLQRNPEESRRIFDDGFLRVEIDNGKAEIKGKACALTPTEFRLLREFVLHRGKLLTYDILLDSLWENGGQLMDKHALAVNVNRLRKKIEAEQHNYISNVYGMGYQWLD